MPDLKDQTYKERSKKKIKLTLKKRRAREDLITIYKLVNNLEETDRKDLMKRNEVGKCLRGY